MYEFYTSEKDKSEWHLKFSRAEGFHFILFILEAGINLKGAAILFTFLKFICLDYYCLQ